MSVLRGLTTVLACCVGFGVAGGLLGLALGVGAPSYYRGVFGAGNDPGFNPVQVGAGLGLTQGLICGVVVGCVVVLAAALSGHRSPKGVPDDFAGHPVGAGHPATSLARFVLGFLVVSAAIVCGGAVGFVVGAMVVETEAYRKAADARLARVEPNLKSEFAGITAARESDGRVSLYGTLGSEAKYKALQERLRFLFGDEEGRSMMRGVDIAKEGRPASPTPP